MKRQTAALLWGVGSLVVLVMGLGAFAGAQDAADVLFPVSGPSPGLPGSWDEAALRLAHAGFMLAVAVPAFLVALYAARRAAALAEPEPDPDPVGPEVA